MPRKTKFIKRQRPLITLFIGITASLITSVIILLSQGESIQDKWEEIFITICVLLILFMMVVLFYINELNNLTESNLTSVEDIIKNNLDGFRIISAEEMLEIATDEIKHCNSFRVIGIARQHSRKNTREHDLMNNYLLATEKRLSKLNRESNGLNYRRITQRDNTEKFKNHLYTIMEQGQSNGHQVSIVLFDDYKIAYTYSIFDHTMVILQVQNISLGHTTLDAKLNLISHNPKVVSVYSDHFDRVWSDSLPINSKEKLNFEFDKVSDLIEKLNDSRKLLSSIRYTSSAFHHGKLEVEQVHSRLEGLSKGKLKVEHKVANGKLLSILSNYIGQLRKNEVYKTISFYEFWQEIEYPSENLFVENNIRALEQKAKIYRLFAVNKRFIENPSNYPQHKNILEKKIKLIHKIFNESKGKFYLNFMFLKDSDYKDKLTSYYQSSIFNKAHETILFNPANRDNDSKIYEGSTEINYIDKTPEINNVYEKKSKIHKSNFEKQFDEYWIDSLVKLKKIIIQEQSIEYQYLEKHNLLELLQLTLDDDGITPPS